MNTDNSLYGCKTPVALVIFNRPDTTKRVFAEIAKAKPRQLLVVADGPRPERPQEADLVGEVRRIIERVDWSCEVRTNYSDQNLGCRRRVSSGLDWVFSEVHEAIILEDDCVPDTSFFRYCEELLDRYREDDRIGHIGGANFQFGRRRSNHSYYFSRYNHVWGWASWRRAWRHYDVTMKWWPELRGSDWLRGLFCSRAQTHKWTRIFDEVHSGAINTWDYQWTFACWLHGMLSVVPETNLVWNIGFGANATHTSGKSALEANTARPIGFPLRHPAVPVCNMGADRFTYKTMYDKPLTERVLLKIRSMFGVEA